MRNGAPIRTTYWDTASSEPLHPAARAALLAALDGGFADPRRLHGPARTARLLLDNARAAVAESLGVRPDEVTFTGSGTEAVHRGLLGLLAGRSRVGDTLLASAVEHAAVGHAATWWRGQDVAGRAGRIVGSLPVERTGRVSVAEASGLVASAAARGGVAALAVQAANHEVGTRQPVAELAGLGVPVFMDACAAMGRVDLPEGWAVAAGSAHKWGGPAGVGLLVVRRGVRWRNPFPGDDRADERAAGFENVPGALASAAALQAVVAERDEVGSRQRRLVDRLRAGIAAGVPDVEVVGDPVDRLPHLLTVSFLYVDGEALVTELDRRGFAVASGSACTTSTQTPSHVLAAMGVLTHGNLRISLTREAAEGDVDALLAALPDVVGDLRRQVGM